MGQIESPIWPKFASGQPAGYRVGCPGQRESPLKGGQMARLIIKAVERQPVQIIELKPGVNRFGRNSGNDHLILHPAVSECHCELVVNDDSVLVRDLGSTNGTYIDRQPVSESAIVCGQTLSIGPLEMVLETPPVVALPELPKPVAAAPFQPRLLADGYAACLKHSLRHAVWDCPGCSRVYCDDCVRKMRRVGGAFLRFCPACSHICRFSAWTEMMRTKKKSFIGKIADKVKHSFKRTRILASRHHSPPPASGANGPPPA